MDPNVLSNRSAALRALPVPGERTIVRAALRGDEAAFRELYGAFRDPIWILIKSMIGDSTQAQDVLQNVFFKAFRGLGGFRFESCLFTWIYRIALNECRNHLRDRGLPAVPLESILGSRDEIDGKGFSGRAEEGKAALRNELMRLPLKMREVIVLKYVEDLTYKEMSRILGCPPGTVASRLARALAELETRLRRWRGF